jgi:hypothetical protein
MTEIPQRVSEAMVKAGAVDPRNGNPSLRQLGVMAGVHTTTVGNLILRGVRISPENLTAIAEVLRVKPDDLLEWCAGEKVRLYSPPAGAELLSERERRIVDEMIRVLIENKENTSGDTEKKTVDAQRSDPRQKMTQARFGLAARNKPGLRDMDEGR